MCYFLNYTPHKIALNNGLSYDSVGVARISNNFSDFDANGVCDVRHGDIIGLPTTNSWFLSVSLATE